MRCFFHPPFLSIWANRHYQTGNCLYLFLSIDAKNWFLCWHLQFSKMFSEISALRYVSVMHAIWLRTKSKVLFYCARVILRASFARSKWVLASTTATAAKTSLKMNLRFSNFIALIPIHWKCLVLRRQQTISRRLNKLTVLILRLLKLTCSDNNSWQLQKTRPRVNYKIRVTVNQKNEIWSLKTHACDCVTRDSKCLLSTFALKTPLPVLLKIHVILLSLWGFYVLFCFFLYSLELLYCPFNINTYTVKA